MASSEKHEPEVPENSETQPTTPTSSVAPGGERSDTILSTISSIPGPHGEVRMTSMFFVVQALETIHNTKEGKRKGPLKDAIAKALGIIIVHGS